MSTKLTVEIEFDIGTLEELGYGGFKQPWIDATGPQGGEFSLTAGAGVGNSLLEASACIDGRHLYAKADIRPVANAIFAALEAALEKEGTES